MRLLLFLSYMHSSEKFTFLCRFRETDAHDLIPFFKHFNVSFFRVSLMASFSVKRQDYVNSAA